MGIASSEVPQMLKVGMDIIKTQDINFPNFQYREIKDAPVTFP